MLESKAVDERGNGQPLDKERKEHDAIGHGQQLLAVGEPGRAPRMRRSMTILD